MELQVALLSIMGVDSICEKSQDRDKDESQSRDKMKIRKLNPENIVWSSGGSHV